MKVIGDTQHRIPGKSCPDCGKVLDATSGSDHDNAPRPGDYGVCIYCAGIHQFADDLSIEAVTMDDVDPSARAGLRDAVEVVHRFHKERPS